MSDLSGLNPTPHAIAVYASSPLSPVATQHSLPSGRYSLLGPDFHRPDRTSLRLAHSLDHLVGDGEQLVWNIQIKRFCGLPIDHELEFRRLLNRQFTRARPLEDFVHIEGCPTVQIRETRAERDEATGIDESLGAVHGRNPTFCFEVNNLASAADRQRVFNHDQGIDMFPASCLECAIKICGCLNLQRLESNVQNAGGVLAFMDH